MTLWNKFNLDNPAELARLEERLSKQKAIALWRSDELKKFQAGTFAKLSYIHKRLFEEIYDFAGKIRKVNISNGRSMRLWLDDLLRNELHRVIDWSRVDKTDYLQAMERSPINDAEIKLLLVAALTDKIDDREVFMKGLDASYFYENYFAYRSTELDKESGNGD